MNLLKKFITDFEQQNLTNCVSIYFSRRITANDTSKYSTHQPVAADGIQKAILDTILPYIKLQLESHAIVEYNPVGIADGELEKIPTAEIPMFDEFTKSLEKGTLSREMDSLKIEKIGFYCVQVNFEGKTMYIFRQFQKLKKLRSGLLTRLVSNELNVIESDFLGIDEFTDIIAFENNLYLLNHTSLERIFNYRYEFLRKTNEALGEILSKDVLCNIEQFTADCCSDIRIMKRFTNIMTKDRLPMFFDNYERVPEIVTYIGTGKNEAPSHDNFKLNV